MNTRINTGLFKDLKRLFFFKNTFRPGSSPLAPTKTSGTLVSEVFLFTQMTIFERSLPHRAEIHIVKAIYASAFMSMASPFYAV